MMSKIATSVLGLLLLLPMAACQEHDPLSPLPTRQLRPKVSKTLSDGVAVASPVDMNTAGTVLGYLYTGANHAAISVNGAAYDLGTTDNLPTSSSYPGAINNRGQVVGNEYSGGASYYGFLWTPDQPNGTTGTMQRLPDTPNGPATALDINDAGQAVGIPVNTPGIVLWHGSEVVLLPLPIAGGSVYWCTINNFGQIAGTAADDAGDTHPFLWTPATPNGTTGSYVILNTPANLGGYTAGLNDFGQVIVNAAEGQTQLWTPASANGQNGTWTTLEGPTGAVSGVDINSRGDVLTSAYADYNESCYSINHLFLWRPSVPNGASGTTIDLAISAVRHVCAK